MNRVEGKMYRYLLQVDTFCEYLPGISTLVGSVHLLQRMFFLQKSFFTRSQEEDSSVWLEKKRYFEKIQKAPQWRVCATFVPFLGNLSIFLYDLSCLYASAAKMEKILAECSAQEKGALEKLSTPFFGPSADQSQKGQLLRVMQKIGSEEGGSQREKFLALLGRLDKKEQSEFVAICSAFASNRSFSSKKILTTLDLIVHSQQKGALLSLFLREEIVELLLQAPILFDEERWERRERSSF